jgi:hypothetical protein
MKTEVFLRPTYKLLIVSIGKLCGLFLIRLNRSRHTERKIIKQLKMESHVLQNFTSLTY